MSLVIAIKDRDRVILGANKQVSWGGSKSHDGVKIWEASEFPHTIIGSVGMVRVTQIIQANQIIQLNDLISNEGPSTTFIIRSIIPRILNILETNGIKCDATIHEDLSCSEIPNSLIIAMGGEAWIISTDLCVSEIKNYAAIGSGELVAQGCLFATNNNKNPFERIAIAVDATAETTLYVDDTLDFATTKSYEDDCVMIDKLFARSNPVAEKSEDKSNNKKKNKSISANKNKKKSTAKTKA